MSGKGKPVVHERDYLVDWVANEYCISTNVLGQNPDKEAMSQAIQNQWMNLTQRQRLKEISLFCAEDPLYEGDRQEELRFQREKSLLQSRQRELWELNLKVSTDLVY